jgi:hypothetical protein
LDWVPAGALNLPPDTPLSEKPYTLQRATAVSNGGHVSRRTGSSTWIFQGKALSVDHDDSCGITFDAVYRDGVLVTSESAYAFPARVPKLRRASSAFLQPQDLRYRLGVRHLRPHGGRHRRDAQATRWNVGLHASDTAARARACRE